MSYVQSTTHRYSPKAPDPTRNRSGKEQQVVTFRSEDDVVRDQRNMHTLPDISYYHCVATLGQEDGGAVRDQRNMHTLRSRRNVLKNGGRVMLAQGHDSRGWVGVELGEDASASR
jgi:hypothetical protein